jgi:hypothetical protein
MRLRYTVRLATSGDPPGLTARPKPEAGPKYTRPVSAKEAYA